jgi:hypothetical protein
MPIIKNQDLDLDVFLHSVIYLSNIDVNKQFDTTLGNTYNAKLSLNNFLDFNLITNHFKSHISPSKNGTILDITFKFIAGSNMRLIYISFYTSKKK